MIIEFLLFIGLLWSLGAIARSGSSGDDDSKKDKDDDEDNKDSDRSGSVMDYGDILKSYNSQFQHNQHNLYGLNSRDMYGKLIRGNENKYSLKNYWENPITGDYIKHRIDIEFDE